MLMNKFTQQPYAKLMSYSYTIYISQLILPYFFFAFAFVFFVFCFKIFLANVEFCLYLILNTTATSLLFDNLLFNVWVNYVFGF